MAPNQLLERQTAIREVCWQKNKKTRKGRTHGEVDDADGAVDVLLDVPCEGQDTGRRPETRMRTHDGGGIDSVPVA